MNKSNRNGKLFAVWASLVLASPALAADSAVVSLNAQDLEAGLGLLRASSTRVVLDGIQGTITPSVGFQGMGFAPLEFPLATTPFTLLFGIQIQDMNVDTLPFSIGQRGLKVTLNFEDEGEEIQSRWGSIDLTEISASFELVPGLGAPGMPVQLVPAQEGFRAKIARNRTHFPNAYILPGVLALGNSTLFEGARAYLSMPTSQAAVMRMLSLWAEIATGRKWERVELGTLAVVNGTLTYTVSE